MFSSRRAGMASWTILSLLLSAAQSAYAATITLDPETRYQTINGWEAHTQSGAFADDPVWYWGPGTKSRPQIVDRAVNEMGMTRLRVEVRSGMENNADYFADYFIDQTRPRDWWRNEWENPRNDDSDPRHINWSGFHFSELDVKYEDIVLPMKQSVEANGEKFYINLCYVDFRATTDSAGFEHYRDPEEYAEFMEAVFLHLDDKYGVVPDGIEPILEPDNASGWSAVQIANAIVATAQRLAAHGYHPDFIAPSTKGMGAASSYFHTMRTQVPEVMSYLSEISYHRYSGVSASNLQAIEDIAVQYDLGASMLELWFGRATYQVLHQDLKEGRNTAWQSGTLAYLNNDNSLYNITMADADTPVVTLNQIARFLRQYFRFIRPGATRIEATTENADFDPLAFENADGKPVVVVKASSGGAFTIGGLPPGVYGIKYTTTAAYDVDQLDQTLVSGQDLSTSIPQHGVITIYGKELKKLIFLDGFESDSVMLATSPVGAARLELSHFSNVRSGDAIFLSIRE